MNTLQRDLGKIEATQAAMKEDVKEVKEDIEKIKDNIAEIKEAVNAKKAVEASDLKRLSAVVGVAAIGTHFLTWFFKLYPH